MSDRRYFVVLVAIAAGLFLALVGYMRSVQARALSEAASPLPPQAIAPTPLAAELPHVPEVADFLRALKLITVEIDTTVAVRSTDESWRGGVDASVVAPVRLLYGIDLAHLPEHAVRSDPLSGGLTVHVPAPRRLATEVFGDAQHHDVRVGWGRLRDRAGEYHLGLARERLYEQARSLQLTPEQRRRVESTTREQVATLVRLVLGASAPVDVRFEDEPRVAEAAAEGARP